MKYGDRVTLDWDACTEAGRQLLSRYRDRELMVVEAVGAKHVRVVVREERSRGRPSSGIPVKWLRS